MSRETEQHDLVSAVKELAAQLGRSPTRDEFIASIRSGKRLIKEQFGSFVTLLQAAGMQSLQGKHGRIDNTIFERSLQNHLEQVEAPPLIDEPWPTFASISDIHWPFENQTVIDRFCEYVQKHQPEWIILNGDAWDMYSHSKFPRSHNVFTPREERDLARRKNEDFWREIRRVAPSAKLFQLLGNHDVRPLKRIAEAYPAAEDWIEEALKKEFTFEGVTTIYDPREELMLDPRVAAFHGYRSQLGAHRDYTLLCTINGHTHKGGVVFRRIRGRTLWEGNSGLAGNPEAKGLTYTPQRITDWTPGFLAGDFWGPRFIPC